MKKIALLFAVALIGFTACEKKNEVKFNDTSVECPYSDEEILKSIKFVGQGELLISDNRGNLTKAGPGGIPGITFSVRIATPKSGCKDGFGLCDPEAKKVMKWLFNLVIFIWTMTR